MRTESNKEVNSSGANGIYFVIAPLKIPWIRSGLLRQMFVLFTKDFDRKFLEIFFLGSAVLTVRAKDQDAGANADVHYSIVNPFGVNEAFRIDPKTGVISTRLALDRETVEEYNVTVQAVDQGSVQERKSATTQVKIRVGDENDNYPQFSERTYTVEVAENVAWADNPIIARIRYGSSVFLCSH